MKLLLLLLLLAGCEDNDKRLEDYNHYKKLNKVTCVGGKYTNLACKITIGNSSYCASGRGRSAVAVSCDFYEEAKRVWESRNE